MLEGILAAFIAMTAWGSYFVPMKKVKEYNPFYFQLVMCVAIFISSFLVSSYLRSFSFTYLGLLSGLFWASGNILSAIAVKKAGLSKSAPVWMGTGIVVSFLWGFAFFHEILTNTLFGILGIILLIFGIWKVSQTSETNMGKTSATSVRNGIILALAAGLLFGTYFVPFKLSGFSPLSYLFSLSTGILLGGVLLYIFKRPNIDLSINKQGALSGVLWNIGNVASFFAVTSLGLTIGFALTQLALFVSVLWGLLYFKEIKSKKNIMLLIFSSIILFLGAILLTLAK